MLRKVLGKKVGYSKKENIDLLKEKNKEITKEVKDDGLPF